MATSKAVLNGAWEKVGECSLSRSKKVVLLAIFELESKRWLVVDVPELFELLAGHRVAVPIVEKRFEKA